MASAGLQAIDAGLWCLSSHFTQWGCHGSVRMTVIGTAHGMLIYSPVAVDADRLAELRGLGSVSAIMAPNLFHHMFLRPCLAQFPDARVLVPEGLEAKIGPIAKAEVMSPETDLGLGSDVEHHVSSGHILNETLLFHRPTATLITADLLYNFQEENYPVEKFFFRAIGCYGAPKLAFYHRFAVRDAKGIDALIARVREWGPRRIIMCHGRIVEGEDLAEVFAAAWARYAARPV